MTPSEYTSCDGFALAGLIKRREISAREAFELALSVHAMTDASISSVIEIWEDEITRIGSSAGPDQPFYGVPFLVKDLVLTVQGRRSEAGSRLASDLVAPGDSTLMSRFRSAGLVPLGRTKSAEYGSSYLTEPKAHGPARNPWNLSRTPGGSSGGTAAAVAAGVVPIGHANDAAGSIRMPASSCGLVGLKPSRARISAGPFFDEIMFGLPVEFVVSRSIRDSALLLDAVSGGSVGDYLELPRAATSYNETISSDPKRLKIGVQTVGFDGRPFAPEVASALSSTAALCEELGHDVEEAQPDLGLSWDAYVEFVRDAFAVGTAFWIDSVARATGRFPSLENLERPNLALLERGKEISATKLLEILQQRNIISRSFASFFEHHDLYLSPTLPGLSAEVGALDGWEGDASDWFRGVLAYSPLTSQFNVSGLPAISLPVCHDEGHNLPIGMQFGAAFGREDLLLQVGAQLERVVPWHMRRPPLLSFG